MSGFEGEEFSCHCGQTLYGFRSYRAHLPFCTSNTGNTTKDKGGTISKNDLPVVTDAVAPSVANEQQATQTFSQPFANLFDVMMEGMDGEPESDEGNNDNVSAGTNLENEVQEPSLPEENTGDDWGDNIINPSTVELPQVIQKEMFKVPQNFDDKYLYNKVLSDEYVRF